jgi:hypothetical protein
MTYQEITNRLSRLEYQLECTARDAEENTMTADYLRGMAQTAAPREADKLHREADYCIRAAALRDAHAALEAQWRAAQRLIDSEREEAEEDC